MSLGSTKPLPSASMMSKAWLTNARRLGFMAPRTPPKNSSKPMSPEPSLSKYLKSERHSLSVRSRAHSAMAFLNSSGERAPLPLSSMILNFLPSPIMPLAPLDVSCFLRREMMCVTLPVPAIWARLWCWGLGAAAFFFFAMKPRDDFKSLWWMSTWSAATDFFFCPLGVGFPTLFLPGASPTPVRLMEDVKVGLFAFIFLPLLCVSSTEPLASMPMT
mmetsp:Transcript_27870/g.52788  ORF Transcript_27870/g.52788 Transcript_27870/m.52788 type:complete len:217 (-) Transcript_27870:806-1456(-)